MATPESRVKHAVNRVLGNYPESYVVKAVPFGYGESTLDYLVCHYGVFISIETKAPGKKPTARQNWMIAQVITAQGVHFTIDGADKCGPLQVFLEQVKQNAVSPRQFETPLVGGAARTERGQLVSRRDAVELWRNPAYRPPASADGDAPVAAAGIRRPKSDPDAL